MAATQLAIRVTERVKAHEESNPTITNEISSPWSLSFTKRALDLLSAVFIMILAFIPMALIAVVITLTSRGNALFLQNRIGRYGQVFRICKFRTMKANAEMMGGSLTNGADSRITGVGRFLRRFKLDEFPQLINVIRGEMSLVGPRPKVPRYAETLNMPYLPGLTGAASLYFRDEEDLLRAFSDPDDMDAFYIRQIMPVKANLDAEYMCKCSFWSDMHLIMATFFSCFNPPHSESAGAFKAHLRKQVVARIGAEFGSITTIE